VHIRRLRAEDAEEFARLRLLALQTEPQAFRETAEEHRAKPLEFHAERLRTGGDTSCVFGAFDGGQLVGTAGLYRNRADWGCVWGMFVDERYRGRSVGKKLLEALLEHVRSLTGLREVHLTVATTQRAARQLYLRCGFEVTAETGASACGDVVAPGQELMKLLLQKP
jgi:RimJ/RimL family protein N-acetyltransferase